MVYIHQAHKTHRHIEVRTETYFLDVSFRTRVQMEFGIHGGWRACSHVS